jgi:hypothetical protein
MKTPTHAAYHDGVFVKNDESMSYLLENTDEALALEIVKSLSEKSVTVDAMLATLIYATAVALHCNYEDTHDGESVCCNKSKHLSNFLHTVMHGLFDFDRRKDETGIDRDE